MKYMTFKQPTSQDVLDSTDFSSFPGGFDVWYSGYAACMAGWELTPSEAFVLSQGGLC